MSAKFWMKKRTDPMALYIACRCGIGELFEAMSENPIHEDDVIMSLTGLGISKSTIDQLFELTNLSTQEDGSVR